MPITRRGMLLMAAMLGLWPVPLLAQIENPVYVDDSPQAWELFRQARDQSRNNAGEAVRLYQELLDEFGFKLIPSSESSSEHLVGVRQRVTDALLADPAMLDRYRVMQSAPAEQLLQAGELERLALTRLLTESGLESLLRLGQRELEAGRFRAALHWLEQARTHPDLARRRAALCLSMTGMAFHYLGEAVQAQAIADELSQSGTDGQACAAQLNALIAKGLTVPDASVRSVSTLDFGQASELDDVVAQAIWSVSLEDSLLHRRNAAAREDQPFAPPGAPLVDPRQRDADLATAMPTVAGELVFINQGHTVLALNRLTGRQVWKYSNLSPLSFSDRDAVNALDMNIVSATTDAVVTLTGYAQLMSRSESGRVICLDAQTGSLRWSASLAGLVDAASNEQLYPYGVPVIAEGMVFVAARRVSMQAMTSEYVVGIDLASGNVRWVRYITSSGGLRAGIRPLGTMVHARVQSGAEHPGGATVEYGLFVSSAVGATARIEPTTGEIRWLCRFNTPIGGGLSEQSRRPWEMTGPVITPLGVIAVEPDQRRVVVLDVETGAVLASHSSNSTADWNQPRYLLADDKRVYAVGSEIRAFNLEDLEVPAWRLPAVQETEGAVASAPPVEIRGRVQVVGGALIVPTAEALLLVDSATGQISHQLAVQGGGNPLAVESQLLLASGERLDSFMSFTKAQRMLRDRITQSPAEPEPALSLLRLGMRVRNLALSLEAADLAMRAIDRLVVANTQEARSATYRAELNALLLELAQSNVAATPQEGESLFAALNSAAVETPQRVEYLLAYGQWLESHALDRAVESYQSILSNATLAESWRADGGTMRPAAAWARQRVMDLMTQRGPAVYSPQADFAALRLKQITAAATPPLEDLQALSEQFPFSDAAIDAAIMASAIQLQRGETRAAAATLVQLYRDAPRAEAAPRLLGKFVSICLQAGWTDQCEAVMRQVNASHGDLALITDAGPLSPVAWLQAVDAERNERGMRLPVVHDIADATNAQVVPGSLVPPYQSVSVSYASSASRASLANRALLRDGKVVRLAQSPVAQPLWTAPLADDLPEALWQTDRDVLLWFKSDPQDPKAVMINANDGKTRWTTPRIADLLADPVRDLARNRSIRDHMPDGEAFDPNQTLPLVNSQSIIVVQRTGGVAAIDLVDGRTPRWIRKQTLEQVHLVALHETALVLAGMAREAPEAGAQGEADLVPRILVLDPATGHPLLDQALALREVGRGGVKWMRVTPLGTLVYGSMQGVHAIDLYTGKRLWSNADYAALDSQRAWQIDDQLVIEDQRSRLRAMNLRDGSVSEPFEAPVRGEWDPLELRQLMIASDRVIAHYPQRIVAYDASAGAIAGADVVSDDRDYRWLLPAQDQFVLISSRTLQSPIPDQPGRRTQQWTYLIYVLSDNCKLLGEPAKLPTLNDRVQQAAVIDGWLLLSTQSETLSIPMSK